MTIEELRDLRRQLAQRRDALSAGRQMAAPVDYGRELDVRARHRVARLMALAQEVSVRGNIEPSGVG